MSFGGSLRTATYGQEKPVIFWEQQAKYAAGKKTTKKLSYKEKEQKYPLRSKRQPPEPAPTKPAKATAKRQVAPTNKAPGTKTKPSRPTHDKKPDPNVVTLTETQLNTILSTIGKLANQNEALIKEKDKNPKPGSVAIVLDDGSAIPILNTDTENILSLVGKGDVRVGAESAVPVLSPLPWSEDSGSVRAPRTATYETAAPPPPAGSKYEPDPASIPGLQSTTHQYGATPRETRETAVPPLATTSRVEPDPASIPGLQSVAHKYGSTPREDHPPEKTEHPVTKPPPVPKAHLTKVERKRLQWEQEQKENEENTGPPWLQLAKQSTPRRRSTPADHVMSDGTSPTLPNLKMTKAELKRLQWENERKEDDRLKQQAQTVTSPLAAAGNTTDRSMSHRRMSFPPDQPSPRTDAVPAQLTRAQKKRLELEKQKAEQIEAYDPWGKPGAGAPVRDSRGNILADFNQRRDTVPNPQHPPAAMATTTPATQPDEYLLQKAAASRRAPPAPEPPPPTVGPAWATNTPPAAMRSSFSVGAALPDEKRYESTKEAQKRQWLEDLERQRQEQMAAKQRERERQKAEDLHDTWADRFSTHNAAALPPQHTTDDSTVAMMTNTPRQVFDARTNSAPTAAEQEQVSDTHIRGQNTVVDPVTRQQMEDKRRKNLEHQEAIKAQVEAKAQKKREEQERRRKEEMEEERKLQAERDRIQKHFDIEQQKIRDKEETQKRRVEALKQAMDDAQQEADRERHAKRVQRLQQGGHDTRQLNANFEAPTNRALDTATDRSDSADEELQKLAAKHSPRIGPPHASTVPGAGVHVEPTYVPGLHPTPRDQQTVYSDTGYEEGRVLTPTVYRTSSTNLVSPRREFGVQTDLAVLPDAPSKESTGIEFQGPFKDDKKSTKKVRVKSAEKEPKSKSGPVKINERPKWGQKSVPKKVTKQSERDPNFQRRQEERRARNAQRQQELLDMAAQNAPEVSKRSTFISRNRSKSREDQARSQAGQRAKSTKSDTTERTVPHQSQRTKSPSPNRQEGRLPRFTAREEGSHRGDGGHRSRTDTVPSNHHGYSPRRTSPPVPSVRHHTHTRSPTNGPHSPPIPAMKHKTSPEYDLDAFSYDRSPPEGMVSRNGHKYGDPSGTDTNFVPFVRSINVLDPAHAEEPLPLSREGTSMERARQAYIHNNRPADYGNPMENYEDSRAMPLRPPPTTRNKDPIMNPSMVKETPTHRQESILQRLSDLRRGLMQKQRELEIGLPAVEPE